jgi:hypothetical protein
VSQVASSLGGVPGILTRDELATTASYLAALQLPSGQVPWFTGGHSDPWNHVEAAMALTVTGYDDEARAAYRWLAATQLGDGSWFNYYLGDRVRDTRLDTNVCAYVAAGLYHYVRATERSSSSPPSCGRSSSGAHLRTALATRRRHDSLVARRAGATRVLRALNRIVLDLSLPSMRRGARGTTRRRQARVGVGRRTPRSRRRAPPRGLRPQERVRDGLVLPDLLGRPTRSAGVQRIGDGWERHVMEGLGVRCVSTNDWVTAAETAECVLALDALGLTTKALDLFRLHASTSSRGRRVLDRHRLPRPRHLPRSRDHVLHRGRHHPRRRRADLLLGRLGLFRHDEFATPLDLRRAGLSAGALAPLQHAQRPTLARSVK